MSERLTLQDLTDLLAEKQGVTKKDAENFLRELIATISESVEQNNSVKIKDFGTFKLVKVNSRKSVDVNTGEANEIPAHYKLSFTPEKSLKDALNVPFSHFESVVIEDGVDFEAAKAQIEQQLPPDDDEEEEDDELAEEKEADVEIVEEKAESKSEDKIVAAKVEEPEVLAPIIVEEEKTEEIEVEPEILVVEPEVVTEPESVEPVVEIEAEKVEAEVIEDEAPIPFTNKEESSETNDSDTQDKEEDEDDDDDEMQWEDNSKSKWIIIGLLFLAIIGACLYIYRDDFFGSDKDKVETVAEPVVEDNSKLILDSLVAAQAADSLSAKAGKSEEKVSEVDNSQKEYAPKEVVTVKRGETLRLLALKHYGSKTFWVYIYQDNKSKIANFNYLQAGQTIAIPAAEKYGINVSDSKSLAKAKAIEDKYFGNK